MAETVRQMVVKLSMDAGAFKKTAKTIKSQIRNLDRELRSMGDNVDPNKLKEKLSLQESAIENLSRAVKQAENNFRNAKTEADKLAKGKQLSGLTTDLETMKNAAEDTRKKLAEIDALKFEKLSKKLTTMGDRFKQFGRKFSLYIGGPLALLGGKAYKDALNYETVMADIGVATKTSGEELERINDTVLKLSENIPMSYSEIGDLYVTLARAGVPAENLEHITKVVAGLGATTDVSAQESAASIIRFMNVMGLPVSQIDSFASTLVALGNAGASSGNEIFSMAQKVVATGNLAGMKAPEILALSAAFSDMGISAEAGGSATSKLIKAFQLAAETGENLGGSFDEDGELVMGFATVMDMTAEQFKKSWSQDQTGTILKFFNSLADGAKSGEDSVLAMLDGLGMTEIRLSNLIATAASNPDYFSKILGIAKDSWKDKNALADAVEIVYNTAQSKQDIALNKMENTSADVGENIVDILQPVIETVAELVSKFSELDEDTQRRWVLISGALVALGPVASTIGTVADGVGRLVEYIGKVKSGEAKTFKKMMDALRGPVGGWALAALSIGAVVAALENIKSPSEQIVENLKNIKVELDEETYGETTKALQELKAQSDSLSGKQGEHNKNISSAVKAGYGTNDMFGTAIGYEARFTEGEIAKAAGKYADEIDKLNGMIGAETDKAKQDAIAAQRDRLQSQWDEEVAQAKANYMTQISALVSGMMQAQPEAKAALEKAAKDYDVFVALDDAIKKAQESEDATGIWKNFFTEDIMKEYLPDVDTDVPGALALELHKRLTESLTSSLKTAGGEDSLAYTLLQTILSDSLTADNFDPNLTEGALDGLVEALDAKSAAEKLGADFGEGLTPGLADAIKEAETPTIEKLDKLGGALSSEAERVGAEIAAALSAGFNSNINLKAPNVKGGGRGSTTNVNIKGGNTAADMYKIKRALDDYRIRQAKGYGLS